MSVNDFDLALPYTQDPPPALPTPQDNGTLSRDVSQAHTRGLSAFGIGIPDIHLFRPADSLEVCTSYFF